MTAIEKILSKQAPIVYNNRSRQRYQSFLMTYTASRLYLLKLHFIIIVQYSENLSLVMKEYSAGLTPKWEFFQFPHSALLFNLSLQHTSV